MTFTGDRNIEVVLEKEHLVCCRLSNTTNELYKWLYMSWSSLKAYSVCTGLLRPLQWLTVSLHIWNILHTGCVTVWLYPSSHWASCTGDSRTLPEPFGACASSHEVLWVYWILWSTSPDYLNLLSISCTADGEIPKFFGDVHWGKELFALFVHTVFHRMINPPFFTAERLFLWPVATTLIRSEMIHHMPFISIAQLLLQTFVTVWQLFLKYF